MFVSRSLARSGVCLVLLLSSPLAFARPEYAAQTKANCTACHVLPWGGGPRNVFGKVYGSHGFTPAKTSASDVYYGDLRFVDYIPTKNTSQTVNGLALMEAAAAANVQILHGESDTEMRGVVSYNLSPLAGSQVREAYIRFQLASSSGSIPTFVTVGHFYVPFGLLSDEHRTYSRLQTNMVYNNFDAGGALSWNFNPDWHSDFAIVNDFQTGGAFNNGDLTYGLVLNTAWNPRQLPFLIGASGNFEKTTKYPQPFGTSVYGVLSLDRLTHDKISASASFERVDAKNWNNPALNNGQVNPGGPGFFIPSSDSAYQNSILYDRSVGYYGLLKYNITHVWTPFYKLDYLNLSRQGTDNDYIRNGFGIEAYLNSNLILNIRYEMSHVMRGEIADSDVLAAQSDVFAMLRLWL